MIQLRVICNILWNPNFYFESSSFAWETVIGMYISEIGTVC